MLRSFTTIIRLAAVVCLFIVLPSCSSDDDSSTPVNPTPTGDVDEKVRPVLFVHGENESAEIWNVMAYYFLNSGHTEEQVYAVDLQRYMDDGTPVTQTMGEQIKAKMDAIVSATGESRVDIVAHGAGARGVQYYLTQLSGTDRAGHVVFIGGLFDMSLTLNGTVTPSPCEYMTVVSDGMDATQGGNASAGTIANVTNYTVSDADHQQICINGNAFKEIYTFFTGTSPMHYTMPTTFIGTPHKIHGRVLSYIDNEPIAGATVVVLPLSWNSDIFGPQTPAIAGPVTTDADGNFEIDELVSEARMYVRIEKNSTHYASRICRQPFKKGTIMFDRYYMLPKSGGSQVLQSFINGMTYSANHSNVIVRSPLRALYHGRDNLRALTLVRSIAPDIPDSLTFGNASTLPSATAGGDISNVTTLVVYDADLNQQNGSGPVATSSINRYGMSTYDLFFWATNKGYTSGIEINGYRLYFQNWRSGDKDMVWLKFDDLE